MPEYEEKRVSINGLNIHCLDWGDHNAQAMILLHGICSHAHYWDYFSRNMAQHFHILALDQRGHGESDWAQEYGPRHYVIDLETFVAQQRLSNIVLIGHSLGGITAALYAARHPELVGKLIMIDIGPELSEPGVQRMERERAGEPEEFQSQEEAVRYLQQLKPRQSADFVAHQARYAVKSREQGGLVFRFDPALQGTELRSPVWLWQYLEQIICPTLLLHGEESDLLASDVAHRMIQALPFGSLSDIARAGHSIPGDNPREFEQAVRAFLSN